MENYLLLILGFLTVLAFLDWLAKEVLVKPIKDMARIELHRLRDEYRNAVIFSKSGMDTTVFREGDITISNALFLLDQIEWDDIVSYRHEVSESSEYFKSLNRKRDSILTVTPEHLKNHISTAGSMVFLLGILDNRAVRVLILIALIAFLAFYITINPIMFLLDKVLKLIKSISFTEAAELILLNLPRLSPSAPVIIFTNR